MCGIVGIVGFDMATDRAHDTVEVMASRIRHRGPDGGGVVAHPEATIGMTRLAILDVERGHQPMVSDDGSVVIVYNGEIYNARELRGYLEQRGVRFRTHCDTEVILRLYEHDPEEVENRLVGMWAFAIHDRRRHHVVLSRDRFGIKPLFIADSGSALAFASELRCFDREVGPTNRLFDIDHSAAHAMVSWSYVPETRTIYKGVRRLPPATRLTLELGNGRRNFNTYWTLEPSDDAARVRSLDEACEHVDSLLRRAVKEHLESDVPCATLLSGGIDSSLVTAYAHEESREPISAYSIGFDESRFDESPFARDTAAQIGVPIVVRRFNEKTARAKLADALLAYDEPFGDSSSLATYLLSHCVSRDYKVALGGDGGDEVFAGYPKYRAVALRRSFAAVPVLGDALGYALRGLASGDPGTCLGTKLIRKMRRSATLLDGEAQDVYALFTQFSSLARTRILMRGLSSAEEFEEEIRVRFDSAGGTELQKTLASDLGGSLSNDMLVKVDRASLACGLEVRVPLLDHRVVEFGVGLPDTFTLGAAAWKFSGKRVLRTLHERRFGPQLAHRRKQGFAVPVQKWMKGPFINACSFLFDRRRLDRYGILSSAELSDGGFMKWVEGADPWVAWHAFALAAWCESTLGDGPDSLREALDDSITPAGDVNASKISARRPGVAAVWS